MAIVENLDLADEKALARELDARRRDLEARLARQPEV
jgi:hypothetical protein